MSKLKLNITMSIDGFVAGPDHRRSSRSGLAVRSLRLAGPARGGPRSHGHEGGEVNASTPFAEEILAGAGATIMGRNMFGGGPGPWEGESWKGWWGDDPPYHHPVFVLTHHHAGPVEMDGGTTFHFVTDGIESALEQARAAAGGKELFPRRRRVRRAAVPRSGPARRARRLGRSEPPRGRRPPVREPWGRRSSSRSGQAERPA